MNRVKEISRDIAIRLVQPRLTVLITSSSESGDALMAAAWVTPLSYYPPKIGIVLAEERFTYRVISESNYFAVNIMDFKYLDSIVKAGTVSGYNIKDKFSECGLTPVDGIKIPVKVVYEALGVLECEVESMIKFGDHILIAGNVLSAYVKDGFNTFWDLEKYNPVLYISEGHFMTIDKNSLHEYNIQ